MSLKTKGQAAFPIVLNYWIFGGCAKHMNVSFSRCALSFEFLDRILQIEHVKPEFYFDYALKLDPSLPPATKTESLLDIAPKRVELFASSMI